MFQCVATAKTVNISGVKQLENKALEKALELQKLSKQMTYIANRAHQAGNNEMAHEVLEKAFKLGGFLKEYLNKQKLLMN